MTKTKIKNNIYIYWSVLVVFTKSSGKKWKTKKQQKNTKVTKDQTFDVIDVATIGMKTKKQTTWHRLKWKRSRLYFPNIMSTRWIVLKVDGTGPINPLSSVRITFFCSGLLYIICKQLENIMAHSSLLKWNK